ncbi:DUF2752 domain-containing protein [Weeksellaceae bacterium TAE3-ERU29]|nr:DUF2752 domain-containing protein [Weeksellaceae bacterium TAE3-ERU29]
MKKTLKILIVSSAILLGGAFIMIYQHLNPSKINIFPQCFTYQYFHLYCPGCGSQRAIHQLLNFDILKAFRYNPLLVMFTPFLIYIFCIYIYNFLFDKNIRIKIFNDNRFVYGFLVLIIAYFILRNVYLPGLEFLHPPD